jgi:hypothetical protein
VETYLFSFKGKILLYIRAPNHNMEQKLRVTGQSYLTMVLHDETFSIEGVLSL